MRISDWSSDVCSSDLRLLGLHLQQRQVGVLVAADDGGIQRSAVRQHDLHLVRVGDDVVVGDDVAARVDDEAGAERAATAGYRRRLAALTAPLEELLEELLELLGLTAFAALLGLNVDD